MYKPGKANSTRVEMRSLDSACNPYLAFAVLLAAGMKGVEEGYELPPGAEDDVWSLSDTERLRARLRRAAAQPGRRAARDGGLANSSPRRSASTSSTSSCATSARSGSTTAPRSPRSSCAGICRLL